MGGSSSTISSAILSRRVKKLDLEKIVFERFPLVQNYFDDNDTALVEDIIKYFETKTDVFFSHDWGKERMNHLRVMQINNHLKERNLITWCDEEKMEGDVDEKMIDGIDNTSIVLIFVTCNYMEKVAGPNPSDNCKREFNYAKLKKKANNMLPVVMEKGNKGHEITNTENWIGPVAFNCANLLYVNMSDQNYSDKDMQSKMDDLYKRIESMIKKPLKMILQSFLQTVSSTGLTISPYPSQVILPTVIEDIRIKKINENQLKLLSLLHENPGVVNDIVNKLNGNTFLHDACCESYYDVVQKLLELGANVNTKNRNGNTALHFACKGDNLDILSVLLTNYASVNEKNEEWFTPLHEASDNGNLEFVKVLVNNFGAKLSVKTKNGDNPLHRSIWSGNPNVGQFILSLEPSMIDERNLSGETALHIACKENDYESAIMLINNGADAKILDIDDKEAVDYIGRDETEMKDKIIQAIAERENVLLSDKIEAENLKLNLQQYRRLKKIYQSVEEYMLNMKIKSLESQKIDAKEKNDYERVKDIIKQLDQYSTVKPCSLSYQEIKSDIRDFIKFAQELFENMIRQRNESDSDIIVSIIKKLQEYEVEMDNSSKTNSFDDFLKFFQNCSITYEKANQYAMTMTNKLQYKYINQVEFLFQNNELSVVLRFINDEADVKAIQFEIFKNILKLQRYIDIEVFETENSGVSYENLYKGNFAMGQKKYPILIKVADGRRKLSQENEIYNAMAGESAFIIQKHEYSYLKKPEYLVVEYFGKELTAFLKPSSDLIVPILKKLLRSIEFLHSKNICHLDLKPQNILVNVSHLGVDVKLCDFENSRTFNSLYPQVEGKLIFTRNWCCPEVYHCKDKQVPLKASFAMDMFSAGLILATMLDKNCNSDFTILPENNKMFERALNEQLYLDDLIACNSSDGALYKKHVLKMCRIVPSERYSINELLSELSKNSITDVYEELNKEKEALVKSSLLKNLDI